jgi:hypothetical protein
MKYVIVINQGVLHEMGMTGKIKANHVAVMEVIASMMTSNFDKRLENNVLYIKTWYKVIAKDLAFFDLSTHRIRQLLLELEEFGFIIRHPDNQSNGCLFLALGKSYLAYQTSIENYGGVANKLTGGRQEINEGGRQKINDNPNTNNPNTNPNKPPIVFSDESFRFTKWYFDALAPDTVKKTFTEKIRQGWQEVYDQLIAIGYTKEQIKTACTWARQDEFWQQNFRSPKKLLTKNKEQELYIDVFLEKSVQVVPKVVKIEKHVTQEMQKEYDRILKIGFDKCTEEEIVWAFDFQHRDKPALTQMKYPEQLASRGNRITMKAALAQR